MVAIAKAPISHFHQQIIASLSGQGKVSDDFRLFCEGLFKDLSQRDATALDVDKLAPMVAAVFDQFSARYVGEHSVNLHRAEFGSGESAFVHVLSDDRPFLVDSLIGELQSRNVEASLVLHLIFAVERDGDGRLQRIVDGASEDAKRAAKESLIFVQIDALPDDQEYDVLAASLMDIMDQVKTVVDDYHPMLAKVEDVISVLAEVPDSAGVENKEESLAFLKWLTDKNFTFLGVQRLDLVRGSGGQMLDLEPVEGTGLGIMRDRNVYVLRRGLKQAHFTPEVEKFLTQPSPLIVTKSNVISSVHLRSHMDYIGVKLYDRAGKVIGETRIVGLFTSAANASRVSELPLVRKKVDYVIGRGGRDNGGHLAKALENVLEQYPRSELFQIDEEQLADFVTEIAQLTVRPTVRVFPRLDEFDRFVSVIVFVPRNAFSTTVREKIGALLCEKYDGRISAFYPAFPEGRLVRIHYVVGRYSGSTPNPDAAELEREILEVTRGWHDRLQCVLEDRLGPRVSRSLVRKYDEAFSPAFQELVSIDNAIVSIQHLEKLSEDKPLSVNFYTEDEQSNHSTRVQLFHLGGPILLSERVPTFENLGFDVVEEWSDKVSMADHAPGANIHDMMLVAHDRRDIDRSTVQDKLVECLHAIWHKAVADDSYNRLVLALGMDYREAALMRGLGAYLKQIGLPFSQDYLSSTLLNYPDITRQILDLFHIRFDPDNRLMISERIENQKSVLSTIEMALADVPVLDEDRILRHFSNLIGAAVRTNFYQRDAEDNARPAIAFKFDSQLVEGIPAPVPHREIFVYSPRVEGIHLRGGPVARGGLRWSDRREDFRTEVLGLAKAQQVKNTVIVPKGSKGGFVPQNMPEGGTREDILQEGVACYRLFISSLLSVTDNIQGGEIVAPERTVRHDGDDPYLVVAADKGTAAFSDYANEISTDHGFWLGDAFASGGSQGYDHKKMGITARGAWEAVKRHFREMDKDIQSESIAVIGVGDMSGDVFGNGMLLSKALKVVAAFDHRDIFVDPDPDPSVSWNERKRLFDLGRCSWQDYDQKLISAGGGVFSRSAKSVALSAEIKALTGLDKDSVAPNDLIKALLTSEADLLWFGGIGTYVRAADETDDMVGDRANDALRVTAQDLKFKVVGEGANLGMTQAARIEFALNGGRVNTDAIDNSAGVNSSDLEVNIKIALGAMVESGKETIDSRNSFLADMTDEVAELCLKNNYQQTLTISLEELAGLEGLYDQQRLMRGLESKGLLDRTLEALPSDGELEERLVKGHRLTRPEISVLMGYAKLDLADGLNGSETVSDPYCESYLFKYFPDQLAARHPESIRHHRLREEVVGTVLTNAVLNRGGLAMVFSIAEDSGHQEADVVKAYVAASEAYDTESLFTAIDHLDGKVPGTLQLGLYRDLQGLLKDQTAWFVRHADWREGIGEIVVRYRAGIDELRNNFSAILPPSLVDNIRGLTEQYEKEGLTADLARDIALLSALSRGADIVRVCQSTGASVPDVSGAFFALRDLLSIDAIENASKKMVIGDHYDRQAVNGTLDSIHDTVRGLVRAVSQTSGGLGTWQTNHSEMVERTRKSIEEILDSGALSVAKLAIASASLRELLELEEQS